jgi:hypothetical protein
MRQDLDGISVLTTFSPPTTLPQLKLPTAYLASSNGESPWQFDWPSDPAANPWRESRYVEPRPRQFYRSAWDHASPLAAINPRDMKEMGDWFERDDMGELEADINHLLTMLFPEPAWDDEAWSFLREYL